MNQLMARESRRQGACSPDRRPRARETGPNPGKGRSGRLLWSVGRLGPFNLNPRDCIWNRAGGGLGGGVKGGHSVSLGRKQGGIFKPGQTHLNIVTADLWLVLLFLISISGLRPH